MLMARRCTGDSKCTYSHIHSHSKSVHCRPSGSERCDVSQSAEPPNEYVSTILVGPLGTQEVFPTDRGPTIAEHSDCQ
jgi:hypothetical protein